MNYLGGLVAALLFAAGSVRAGPGEEAEAAYQQKDYTTAMRLWQQLAQAGDVVAQINLGAMYESGQGVAVKRLQLGVSQALLDFCVISRRAQVRQQQKALLYILRPDDGYVEFDVG